MNLRFLILSSNKLNLNSNTIIVVQQDYQIEQFFSGLKYGCNNA